MRWWDGAQWTAHYEQPYSQNATALTAPAGTKTNTVWIWLIIVLPLLPLLGLLSIDWSRMFDYDLDNPASAYTASFSALLSPGYLGAIIGGWIAYGLCALFAYVDWRDLAKAGVPRPFHFAWVFLSSVVYVIGRSVVVKRRTGGGGAPLWGAIASLVLMFVITIVMMVMMFAAVFAAIPSYPQY